MLNSNQSPANFGDPSDIQSHMADALPVANPAANTAASDRATTQIGMPMAVPKAAIPIDFVIVWNSYYRDGFDRLAAPARELPSLPADYPLFDLHLKKGLNLTFYDGLCDRRRRP
jgi:hypothetical protein